MTFGNIVLHIPHSTPVNDDILSLWNDKEQIRHHARQWTDWFTDTLFLPNSSEMNINIVKFPHSRFHVDAERLRDDELEKIGQGIIYTRFGNATREITDDMRSALMNIYDNHIEQLSRHISSGTIVIDCHSFPSAEYPDAADICIGFNNDWSKPSDTLLQDIKHIFGTFGYSVGFNTPYSNAVTPKPTANYKSFMIEVNKRVYMDEENIALSPHSAKASRAINAVYRHLLGE